MAQGWGIVLSVGSAVLALACGGDGVRNGETSAAAVAAGTGASSQPAGAASSATPAADKPLVRIAGHVGGTPTALSYGFASFSSGAIALKLSTTPVQCSDREEPKPGFVWLTTTLPASPDGRFFEGATIGVRAQIIDARPARPEVQPYPRSTLVTVDAVHAGAPGRLRGALVLADPGSKDSAAVEMAGSFDVPLCGTTPAPAPLPSGYSDPTQIRSAITLRDHFSPAGAVDSVLLFGEAGASCDEAWTSAGAYFVLDDLGARQVGARSATGPQPVRLTRVAADLKHSFGAPRTDGGRSAVVWESFAPAVGGKIRGRLQGRAADGKPAAELPFEALVCDREP